MNITTKHTALIFNFCLVLFCGEIFAQKNDVLDELLQTIEQSDAYDRIKVERINDLSKQLYALDGASVQQQFDLNRALFF